MHIWWEFGGEVELDALKLVEILKEVCFTAKTRGRVSRETMKLQSQMHYCSDQGCPGTAVSSHGSRKSQPWLVPRKSAPGYRKSERKNPPDIGNRTSELKIQIYWSALITVLEIINMQVIHIPGLRVWVSKTESLGFFCLGLGLDKIRPH